MGKFKFVETGMEGLYEIEPAVYGDGRGHFLETYNERDFEEAGIRGRFVQDNQSLSARGVLRGLHYQKDHPQGKLARVLAGEVFDVAVDVRRGSRTYGKWHGVVLSGGNKRQFYIPKGFAHGFLVLSEEAAFAYKCTEFYHPEDERGIRWDDVAIGIEWPDIGAEYLLSEKDKNWPGLEDALEVCG
jgi:dTDP-4-dehydrorhamnose 3,5-epimerase